MYEKAKAIETDAAALQLRIATTCPKLPWREDLVAEAKARGVDRFDHSKGWVSQSKFVVVGQQEVCFKCDRALTLAGLVEAIPDSQ